MVIQLFYKEDTQQILRDKTRIAFDIIQLYSPINV